MGDGIEEDLEAVEDLDGAAALDPDDAPEHARCGGDDAVGGGGGGGRGGGVGGVLGLDLDAGVVVGDVDDHQRMELECQATAR